MAWPRRSSSRKRAARSSSSKPSRRSAAACARASSRCPALSTTSARPFIRSPSRRRSFRTLPLAQHGLEWIEPPAMLAHPFDEGPAAVVHRSIDRTASALGADARAYRRLIGDVVEDWPRIEPSVLGPLRWPAHPIALARFGLRALASAEQAVRAFSTERGARAVRRHCRARPAAARSAAERGRRSGPRRDGARRRLGAAARRFAADRRRARRTPAIAWRRDRDRHAGGLARCAAAVTRDPVRSLAASARAHRRRSAAGVVSPPARAVSLRHGRVQSRLGARRADSLARCRLRHRGDRARRRHARGNHPVRVR